MIDVCSKHTFGFQVALYTIYMTSNEEVQGVWKCVLRNKNYPFEYNEVASMDKNCEIEYVWL